MSTQPQKQDNYKAWNISLKDFPKKGSIEEQIKFFIRLGILAPSIHNTQPWKFNIYKNKLIVYPDWSRRLPAADTTGNNLYISLGCCLTNIECAASYYGLIPHITIQKETGNTFSVRIVFNKTSQPNKDLKNLCSSILKRYSNKLLYDPIPLLRRDIQKLQNIQVTGTKVLVTDDVSKIKTAADLQGKAVIALSKNKYFAKELSSWLRNNNTREYDGMPGFVSGLKPIQTAIGKAFLSRTPAFMNLLAKNDKNLLGHSPAMGIVINNQHTNNSAIAVGQVYERVALTARSLGIHCTPMHSIIEDKKQAVKLAELFHIKNGSPKFFFRLGYNKSKPYHTPRRSIETFLDSMDTEKKLIQTIPTKVDVHQLNIQKYLINYIQAGQGPSLLLIHGGNIGWGQWYPNIAELAKYFTVYAIDLPGSGRSTKLDFAALNFQEDLFDTVDEFIKKLQLKNFHVIGSSAGGWIALKLALKYKERVNKLILADALGFSSYLPFPQRIISLYPIAKFMSRTMLKPIRSNKNVEKFIRSVFYDQNLPLKPEFIDYFYETMETSHNLLFISRMSTITGMRKELVLKNELPKIKNKTLIIWGEQDKLMPLRKNQQYFNLLTHGQVQIIRNAGHIPSIEKSKEFNKLTLQFLRA